MNFTSLVFFIFLPIVLFLYWIIPNKYRWIVLLVASYFFYAFLNYWLIFLIVGTTLVSYLCALGISKYQNKKKTFMILSIVVSLIALFVFKYLDFTLSTFGSIFSMFGLNVSINPLNIILPVGISFYTFQTIAYVVDVYKGKIEIEKHIGYYALFVSFFPQLVAGPIERADHLLPELKKEHLFTFDNFAEGLKYFISGFIKKVIIADFVVIYVNNIYNNLSGSSGAEILIATFLFGVVIYCDFSGYSEIALGIAKWMGIDLSINFDRPYLSSSLREFWRRWHITLNNFFTDYIYIPLGGSKKGKIRKYINIIIVFFLSGLWHGASWHFVLWGLISGALLVIEELISPLIDKIKESKTKNVIRIIITFIIVNLLWIFFRAQSLQDISTIFTKIFTSFASSFDPSFFTGFNIAMLFICVILLIFSYYLPIFKKEDQYKYSYIPLYFVLISILTIAYINNLYVVGESSFIYFQF